MTVETPKLWPAGATSAQAAQWWANLAESKRARERQRVADRSAGMLKARPVPSNLGTGRTNFVHFRHSAKSRRADETQTGKTRFPRFVSAHPEAQPMHLPKPMIILGQIQQVTEQNMTDKRDPSKQSKLFLVVFSDKTKPAQFRTASPFCTFLSEEKFRGQFGAVNDAAIDEMITMAVSEIAPYNAFMKCKGQLLKGTLTGEQLMKMQADAAKKEEDGGPVREDAKAKR